MCTRSVSLEVAASCCVTCISILRRRRAEMDESRFIISGPHVKSEETPVSLGHYLFHRLREHGEKVAQVQQVGGQVISHTFSDLLRKGKNVTKFLRGRALKQGDTVFLCCSNTLDFAPVMLGTLFLGGTIAPVNPAFDTNDMLHLLTVIQPAIVICNSGSQAAIKEAIARSSKQIPWVPLDVVVTEMNNQEEELDFDLGTVDPNNDVAVVMCSSGTSGGKPKGVEMIHSRLFWTFQGALFRGDGTEAGKVVMNMAGPYWVSCLLVTLKTLDTGNKLVLLAGFTVDSFLATVQEFEVNWVVIGPDQVVALATCANFDQYDTSSLSSVLVGGAATPNRMYAALQNRLRGIMVQVYGMTENMNLVRPDFNDQEKFGNVGKMTENCEAKVVDIDTGELVGRNCEGELCFRSPTVMKGYRNNPEATAAVFDEDGFMHTGDVGYFDEDGLLFIKDRIKDLIKYRRDHVPPVDIEEVLLSHAAVKEAAVVGVFHEEDWERATAAVVLRQGATATAQELLSLVQEKLPSFKWLHGGLRFVEALPRTSTGKVQKREIREMLKKYPISTDGL